MGAISKAEYSRDLDSALLFLKGRNQLVTERLAERMDEAASELDYERAAQFRDQLARLKAMESEQLVARGGGDFDVIGVVYEHGLACVAVMFFRGGRMLGSRSYFPRVQGEVETQEIARAFLLQYYTAREAPKEILVSEAVDESAAIAAMLEDLKASYGLTLVFIAHDLAVVKNISDRVAVMYLGKMCEVSDSDELYANPAHPYTELLLESLPEPDPGIEIDLTVTAEGELPSPIAPPSGCRFRTRCPYATEICTAEEPQMRKVSEDHYVACHHPLVAVAEPAEAV